MTDLGPEWKPDRQGIPSRKAARLILFDPSGKTLLIRGHDTHDLDHSWWFTVGGGLDDHETPLEGALREASEETGLVIDPACVVGPVVHRSAVFRFRNVVARQDEVFFIAYLDDRVPQLNSTGFTELERDTLDEFRWFSPAQLTELSKVQTVYPSVLPELVERWSASWDGSFVELGDEQDGEL